MYCCVYHHIEVMAHQSNSISR